MEQYNVTGMSCAACSARVEKAVSKVAGVTVCSVSLLTNSMSVEGTAEAKDIIAAVEAAGYGASVKGAKKSVDAGEDTLEDKETPAIRRRLIWSVAFLIILMYISMGHTMLGWPLPSFFTGNHIAMGIVQLLLAGIIMVINQKFFVSGFKGLTHRAPNMDTLVALGSGASFCYSVYELFAMTAAQLQGGADAAMPYMHEFYFESAATILTLITVGKMLEAHSKGKTTDALKSLMRLAPKTASVIINGEAKTVPVEQVKKGDIFVVRPGESIPVDGNVIEGESAVDESALTGESVPVDKAPGGMVSAATINRSGFIKCEATRVGEDTTLSQIIKMVSDASATKAPIAKIADKVSGIFVPAVIAIAAVTFVVWLAVGQTVGYALARAISVLVISCPCALGLATPVAIMVGSGVGAKNGILFKTAVSLEGAGKIITAVLDKTGTITRGEPTVTDIITDEGISEAELLNAAYSLEKMSEHPLSKAVMKKAEAEKATAVEVTNFKAIAGNGLSGNSSDGELFGGNRNFVGAKVQISPSLLLRGEELSEQGKTPMFFAREGVSLGIIAVADVIKDDGAQAINELKKMGVHVVMLTGDNERTARAIGAQAGVDEVIAGVLPDGKESAIRRFKSRGAVAMVGDGINDAPALTSADIGIAIGAGADVAIDAADVVLVKSRLADVPAAIRLSRATLRNIRQNLFWAFIYNIIGIPLAAGVWIPIFGWQLNPMFGAAAMSLSSFCVVTNALRLNLLNIRSVKIDKELKAKETQKEAKTMVKRMKIEGMMCGHCEAHVKKALEALNGVESAQVSHESGTAVVTLASDVSEDTLKSAVEAQDYRVLSVE